MKLCAVSCSDIITSGLDQVRHTKIISFVPGKHRTCLLYTSGHPEYDRITLDGEYKRDLSKGLPIKMPENYYPDNDPENKPLLTWREMCIRDSYRSLYLHFECGVFIYNNSVIDKIERDFQQTLAKCHKISLLDVRKRTMLTKLAGQVLRLFAPLM